MRAFAVQLGRVDVLDANGRPEGAYTQIRVALDPPSWQQYYFLTNENEGWSLDHRDASSDELSKIKEERMLTKNSNRRIQ